MERMWRDILDHFGQEVTLRNREGEVSLRAMVQPILDRGVEQTVPSPLGLVRQDRCRYMGPAEYPLNSDTVVEWKGDEYRVQFSHLVGEGICPHWWAVLYPRDEVEI